MQLVNRSYRNFSLKIHIIVSFYLPKRRFIYRKDWDFQLCTHCCSKKRGKLIR
jgi:hypothetical protein